MPPISSIRIYQHCHGFTFILAFLYSMRVQNRLMSILLLGCVVGYTRVPNVFVVCYMYTRVQKGLGCLCGCGGGVVTEWAHQRLTPSMVILSSSPSPSSVSQSLSLSLSFIIIIIIIDASGVGTIGMSLDGRPFKSYERIWYGDRKRNIGTKYGQIDLIKTIKMKQNNAFLCFCHKKYIQMFVQVVVFVS